MTAASADDAAGTDPTAAYRREARRLRHVYADRPERLHRALGDLARRTDALTTARRGPTRATARRVRPSAYHALLTGTHTTPFAVDRFAASVASQLDGPVLRYSSRLALLRDADQIGLGRFQANLLIAAVQHEAGGDATPGSPSPLRTPRLLLPVLIACEFLAGIATWLVLR